MKRRSFLQFVGLATLFPTELFKKKIETIPDYEIVSKKIKPRKRKLNGTWTTFANSPIIYAPFMPLN